MQVVDGGRHLTAAMSKSFKLIDPQRPVSTSSHPPTTNWNLCIICQDDTKETLTRPSQSKRTDVGSGYSSLAENLIRFNELKELPCTLQLHRLDEGHGIEAAMVANSAGYHETCRLKYNRTKLQRAEKRKRVTVDDSHNTGACKRTRSLSARTGNSGPPSCFFCEQPAGSERLHAAATFTIDRHVRDCATLLEDSALLRKLSAGDMVALECKYHAKCLSQLYNRARAARCSEATEETEQEKQLSRVAFAQLVLFIEETRQHEETAPVFKLAELAELYQSRIEQLGVRCNTRVHSTRLKQRLLAHFPDMQSHSKGRDIMLAFRKDVGDAIAKACEMDSDNDAIHLARAAEIVRRQMFGEAKPFIGFPEGCQKESVPQMLICLVNMILEGPNIKDQMTDTGTAAVAIAQILKFNSVKHKRMQSTSPSSTVRHSHAQETPLPIYVGMMLHAHTRKKELVDRLAHVGLSISYDRVLRLTAQMANSVCEQFHLEQVVCPPSMRGNIFTTAAVDNIDHNPSSTTAKSSFHGTAISLIQHPSFMGEGVDRTIVVTGGSGNASTFIRQLPQYYTDVPPVTSSVKNVPVPAVRVTSLDREVKKHTEEEYLWLHNARQVVDGNDQGGENISWAAFHASRQPPEVRPISPTALLPMFHDSAHTVAMIRHSIDVVKTAVEHLNPGQAPVVTFDQPLFALAKQIQWKWPEKYGEDKVVMMFGGLHIEMAALKTLGDWLDGSGWAQTLVRADITTPGTAESFLRASHVTRTRRAHQVTAAALHILQHRAYDHYCKREDNDREHQLSFEDWCYQRGEEYPQFQYWSIVLQLELLLNVYVRSLRQASFSMYLDALTELACWFHAMDHTNYARWIPVHLKDMAELPERHPEVARKFREGSFTVQKTNKIFSSIAIDQAHEQNNACIKGDGGAVGLTDNPAALRRWMIAGPEVTRVIEEFQRGNQHSGREDNIRHHDQTTSVQASFTKDVRSLVKVMEELGNPFEEDSPDLVALDNKESVGSPAIEAVRKVREIGLKQFQGFVRDCLVERTKPVEDTIHRNKLKVFKAQPIRNVSKEKHKLTCLKNNAQLFSRLYISCQTRDGNLDEFFRHENQACPPALSDGWSLRLGTKSDLLTCFQEIADERSEAPPTTSLVIDGAAIVQMLKPTACKNFREYAQEIFIPYMSTRFQSSSRLDLVWDTYRADSLKASARAKRGKGVRRRVVAEGAIPSNWQNFLRVDTNKTQLFKFLSEALLLWFNLKDKQLVVTDGEEVCSKPPLSELSSLAPCTHEEADSRMMLHVSHAARHGHNKIMIRTVDTDVVVLAVSVVHHLQPENELWIAFGTGKGFRYLAAHEIAARLGPDKAQALTMFHSLTGCDTVSSFASHGKKTAWAVWNVLPELTDALLKLSSAPSEIPEEVLHTIERFVILLYDRTSPYTDIDKARKKLFARKNNVELIPPTKAALEEHVKRAAYQGGHVWGQVLLPAPELPAATSWGWIKSEDGLHDPHWTRLPQAAQSCRELLSCKCKMGCVNRCKCKKAALECTALCLCEGECTQN